NFNSGRIMSVEGKPITIDNRPREVPMTILNRDTNNPNLNSGPVHEGRDLTPEDRGKNVIVLSELSSLESTFRGFTLAQLGIHAGSHIRMRVQGRPIDFEVVGIVGSANGFAPNIAGAFIPPDVPGINSLYALNVVQVDPDHLNEVLLNLSSIPAI